jgi:hypothetical protein
MQIEVLGDTVDEPPLYGGEWGLIEFSNASPNAVLDTDRFFGFGLFVIVDDDPTPTITPRTAQVIEGDAGPTEVHVPVTLSNPSALPVSVDWTNDRHLFEPTDCPWRQRLRSRQRHDHLRPGWHHRVRLHQRHR